MVTHHKGVGCSPIHRGGTPFFGEEWTSVTGILLLFPTLQASNDTRQPDERPLCALVAAYLFTSCAATAATSRLLSAR